MFLFNVLLSGKQPQLVNIWLLNCLERNGGKVVQCGPPISWTWSAKQKVFFFFKPRFCLSHAEKSKHFNRHSFFFYMSITCWLRQRVSISNDCPFFFFLSYKWVAHVCGLVLSARLINLLASVCLSTTTHKCNTTPWIPVPMYGYNDAFFYSQSSKLYIGLISMKILFYSKTS